MIARSRIVFAAVLLASSAVHLGAMTLVSAKPPVQMDGGGPVAETSLGSSFADLTEGVQQPVEAVLSAVTPKKLAALSPIEQEVTTETPLLTADIPMPPKTSSTEPTDPINALLPPEPTAAQSVAPDTVVAALPEQIVVTPARTRPKMRKQRPDPVQAKPTPKKSAEQKPKPMMYKGNADQNANVGTQDGSAAKPSQAAQVSRAMTSNAQGNAAISNYPGEVMRRISRVSRPRTSQRGVAVIQFTIAANGGLAAASIAQSSGSVALDRAALAVVQEAQPFPTPPVGARRSYSIKIKGK